MNRFPGVAPLALGLLVSSGCAAPGDDARWADRLERAGAEAREESVVDGEDRGDDEPPLDDGVLAPDPVDPADADAGGAPAGAGGSRRPPSCDGYTEILGPSTNTARHVYGSKVKAACLAVHEMCAAGPSDTRKILCAALEYDGVYYGNGYSTTYGGSKSVPFYGFSAPKGGNYGLRPADWLAANEPGLNVTNLLECSGLTAVALLRAYAFSSANLYCSGQFTEERNAALFEQLPRASIRPGDFLTKTFGCNSGGSGHVAIAASAVDASGNVIVYETNTWKKPVRFTERSLSYFAGGWSRFRTAAAR
jgi:hypothetical protein